jgi:hypothetical protein
MKTVTAAELLILDAEQFRREYYKWQEYCMADDDMDYIKDGFKEKCSELGIEVDHIGYCISYSQGDGAHFDGRVGIPAFMEHTKMNEKYLALYLACKDDGSYVNIRTTHRGNMVCGDSNMWGNQTAPSGVFSDLPQTDWEELVDSQLNAVDMEGEVLTWCRSLAHDLYISLRDEYEYQTREESFIEFCECNDITFEIEEEDESCV